MRSSNQPRVRFPTVSKPHCFPTRWGPGLDGSYHVRWRCTTVDKRHIGYGATPEEAHRDWRRTKHRAGITAAALKRHEADIESARRMNVEAAIDAVASINPFHLDAFSFGLLVGCIGTSVAWMIFR